MGRVQSQQRAPSTPAARWNPRTWSRRPAGRWRRRAARIAVACITLSTAGLALAQQPAAPPAEAPAAPTTTPITRDMTLEYVLVLAMVGLALFAVCRSTRRN